MQVIWQETKEDVEEWAQSWMNHIYMYYEDMFADPSGRAV